MILNFDDEVAPELMEQRYDELLAEYNRTKDHISELKNEKEINYELQKYTQLIQELQNDLNAGNTQEGNVEAELEAKDKMIQELDQLILTEEETLKGNSWNMNAQKDQLQAKLNEKKKQLEEVNGREVMKVDKSSLENLENNTNNFLSSIQNYKNQIKELENAKTQSLSQFNEVKEKTTFILQENETKRKEKENLNSELDSLKNNIHEKEVQLQNILEELKKLQAQRLQTQKKSQQVQKLTTKLNEQTDKLNELNANIEGKESELNDETNKLSNIEKKSKEEAEEFQNIKKQLENMKTNQSTLREKIKDGIEEKKKLKDEKRKQNPKSEGYHEKILKLQSQNELLQVDIERQRKKLNEFAQIKATYASPDQLATLRMELQKYKKAATPFNNEIKNSSKLDETKKSLEDSIKKLRSMERKIITEKQTMVDNVKQKLKQVLQTKTFYERNISHCQNKLNEYMKEFPSHEKQKEEKKQKERQQKAQQKRLKRQEQEQRKRNAQKNKNNDEDDAEANFLKLPVIEDGDKSQVPIYMNPTYQYGAIGLIVLIVLIGYYL